MGERHHGDWRRAGGRARRERARPRPILSPLPKHNYVTFLVLRRSRECVKGLYSPPAEDRQRRDKGAGWARAPARTAARAVREAAVRNEAAIFLWGWFDGWMQGG